MPEISQRQFQDAVLLFAKGVGGPLAAVRVALFMNNVIPDINTVITDLELVTETGMEAQTALVPSDPFTDTDGRQVCVVPVVPFVAEDDPEEPFVVYGHAILNAGGTTLYLASRYDAPVSIQRADQGVNPTVLVPWGV